MTRLADRVKAIELRKEGKSYSQIKQILGISKSTLSNWLKDMPLTKAQSDALGTKQSGIEKFRKTMLAKRQFRLDGYYQQEKKKWLPLSDNELFIAGLFLYWGEGNKSGRGKIAIYNTDPTMLRFALLWLTKSLKLPKGKIRVDLHLYSDMDIATEFDFWSRELDIPLYQFRKPYIKKSRRDQIDYKSFGHGTCSLVIHNTVVKEHFEMALKAILDDLLS